MVKAKQKMFNINMSVLEGKLTKLFQPMTEFLGMLDNKFQGQIQHESNIDFLLRFLIRLSETFGSKSGLCLNSGTLLRCPYYFASEMFNVEVSRKFFIITAKQNFALPGFSMQKFHFEFLLLINEVIFYQKKTWGAGRIAAWKSETRATTD